MILLGGGLDEYLPATASNLLFLGVSAPLDGSYEQLGSLPDGLPVQLPRHDEVIGLLQWIILVKLIIRH